MVTALTNYLDSRVRADINEGYDGVVRVAIGGYYGTGTLLWDGRAILTAAHLFTGTNATSASVYFETAEGDITLTSDDFSVNTLYDPIEGNNDLALIWLESSAPITAERYDIYRETDEISQTFSMVGYGIPGTGTLGADENYDGRYLRLVTQNRFDAGAEELKVALGSRMAWTPEDGTQLIADFDDGTVAHDALGAFLDYDDRGLGLLEGIISPGDSGGPAFISHKVAGIASYISSIETNLVQPDYDTQTNSSFGEIAAWHRVSHYQEWIDESLRSHYTGILPTTPQNVEKIITEGDNGTSYAYFLLQFTGIRSDAHMLLSVDYQTVDGTASAGEDYIATSGKAVIYPDETQVIIPVEIIGDIVNEENETFSLEVYNPIGGSFGEGVVKLIAVRTIEDDDGFSIL